MTGGYSWLSTKHHHQQHIMEQSASQLLALADELLIEIISQIEDRQSLCCLARVSPRLQGLAEPYIYDSILTRTGDQARNLVQLFESRNARLRAVHDLQIRYLYSSEDGIEDLNAVLKGLTQLRHLRIETPCCNDSPWMDLPGKPALLWANGGRIDIPGLFEMALTLPTSVKPGILGQLQSCMFSYRGLDLYTLLTSHLVQ
jgi:hypothetical protein